MQRAEWVPANEHRGIIRSQLGVMACWIDADALEHGHARDDAVSVFLLVILCAGKDRHGPEGLVLRRLESQQYSRITTFRFHEA